jgi:dTDP-glucose 4,6-dehydratase
MKLLVTGGAGFIGSNFVRLLINLSGFEIRVLDKFTYAADKFVLREFESVSNVEIVEGDICDATLIKSLISDVDAVINFAAESHVDRSIEHSAEFIRTNIGGVHCLIEEIYRSGRKIRFIQVSTDEVYGDIDEGSWDENSPLLPNSPYAASKAAGELVARSYHKTHGCDVIITRGCNSYGPYQFPEKLIPKFITSILTDKQLTIYGDGKNVREWIHVNDHCRAILEILLNGKSGELYNIGSSEEINNLNLTLKLLANLGESDDRLNFVTDRKGHDQRYSMNSAKLNSELNFRNQISLEIGLRETIDWYQENKNWWKDKIGE